MLDWLTLAKGPFFIFVLAFVTLKVLQMILLTAWDIWTAIRRSGDGHLPYRQIALQTITNLLPFNKINRSRAGYSIASVSLHLSILLVPLFLRNHLDILGDNIGFSWAAISKPVLDILTLVGILGISFLFLYRLYMVSSRRLSKTADYLILLLILGIFTSGYLAGRPWNLIPYNSLMLFHTVCGMLFLLLIPYTKVSHCVLFPLIRLGTEAAWHFVPHSSNKPAPTLQSSEEISL